MDLLLRKETKKCCTLQTQLHVATQQLAEIKGVFTVLNLLELKFSIITKTLYFAQKYFNFCHGRFFYYTVNN